MTVTKEYWSGALMPLRQCTPHFLKALGTASQGENCQALDPVSPDRLTLSTGHIRRPTPPLLEDGLQFCPGLLMPQLGNVGSSPLDFSAAESCQHWIPNPSNVWPSLAYSVH